MESKLDMHGKEEFNGMDRIQMQIQQLYSHVQDCLMGVGEDLAMQGAERDEQRWGVPEIGLAAVAVTIWLVQTVAKVLIELKLKQTIAKDKAASAQIRSLEKQIEALEQKVQSLRESKERASPKNVEIIVTLSTAFQKVIRDCSTDVKIEDDDFVELKLKLQQLGITKRHAEKMLPQLRDSLMETLVRIAEKR